MSKDKTGKEPCPCCGYLTCDEPGDNGICRICFWENDLSQLRFPKTGGANGVSLIEGQQNYLQHSVCEPRYIKHVSRPRPGDIRDPEWRPISLEEDNIEESIPGTDYGRAYPKNSRALYYWRSTFWRKPSAG